ncbi:AEC family transporter [Photobacterium swingsii]|uniref:AEC family transporter n=1 Tax=Photobacterium swingsii TaxID=680026 RepID=A0A0J8VGV4_9GAMM|nr:AEC family transporter [Photobacterium swingsii]KMV31710.1 transporter [Photobacterium swingsii]PSW25314.1 AEC family transporter [Photobacterium swingsii]
MYAFIDQLLFSISVTGPIFIMLALGVILKSKGLIDEKFTESGSRLVFNVTLPALLFLSVVKADLQQAGHFQMVTFALIGNLMLFGLFELLSGTMIKKRSDIGVVVQGSFRANTGIIGLAYAANAYGEAGLVIGSLYVAAITVLYNILAVITLTRHSETNTQLNLRQLLRSIIRNPLIISIVVAIPISYLHIELPAILLQSGRYFADMTLPLALLCTGASLDFRQLKQESTSANVASIGRLVIAPAILTSTGYLLGFRDIELGIIFLMSAAPTAAASYVMAHSMGANAKLAANIIALTTIASTFTCSLGITLLNVWTK